jgi:hypothetical protein
MRLSENQYNHFRVLLDSSELMNESELAIQAKVVPGVVQHGLFVLENKEVLRNRKTVREIDAYRVENIPDSSGFSSIKHHSLERNPELVEFLTELAGHPTGKLISMHQGFYGEGTYNNEHKDSATWTMVIIVDADLKKGGDFYLEKKLIEDFREKGDYICYDGSTKRHRVTTIEEGWREVLVVWWWDEEFHNNRVNKQKGLL